MFTSIQIYSIQFNSFIFHNNKSTKMYITYNRYIHVYTITTTNTKTKCEHLQ